MVRKVSQSNHGHHKKCLNINDSVPGNFIHVATPSAHPGFGLENVAPWNALATPFT